MSEPRINISIEGTASQCRSAMAELLGTTAPVAVAAAAAPVAAAAVPAADPPRETAAQKKARLAAEAPAAPKDPTVDPFAPQSAAAAPAGNDPFAAAAGTSAPATAAGPTATTTASPSEGEVTYEELKKLMTDVLSKKSAAFALDVLQKATGHKAMTGMPKDLYPKAKAALTAALV